MMNIKVIKRALAASLAAGALCFASTGADVAPTAEPAKVAEPSPAAPAATTPFTAPRYFNPTPPRQDNPTNPPGTWEVYPSPTANDLHAVDFIDANNGWANGPGVMLRYRGGTWSVEPGHETRDYRDLDMVSTTDGWAVGREGSTGRWTIWRWNGSGWNPFQIVTGAIYCIDMIDASHGWIGGNGYFLRYNGSSWVWGGSAPNTIYGLHMFSDTLGWAVGAPGIVMKRNGSIWERVPASAVWMLADLCMTDFNNGWATGYKRYVEDGIIVKCLNGTWVEFKVYQGTTSIGNIDIYGQNFGWATGARRTSPPLGAFLGFFDGKDWTVVPDPTDKGLGGVKIINANNAWIVGEAGIILKYKPNVSVTPVSVGRIKAIYR